eukprot:763083-Hanusia_phi.AAC.2
MVLDRNLPDSKRVPCAWLPTQQQIPPPPPPPPHLPGPGNGVLVQGGGVEGREEPEEKFRCRGKAHADLWVGELRDRETLKFCDTNDVKVGGNGGDRSLSTLTMDGWEGETSRHAEMLENALQVEDMMLFPAIEHIQPVHSK